MRLQDLPENTRNQQFWAVGAAWEIGKEDFMGGQNIFDVLRLKGSVGVLGNQGAVNQTVAETDPNYVLDNPFYPNLLTGQSAVFGTSVYPSATEVYQANPNLKWETIDAWEVGVEGAAFKNRLTFEANYFNRQTNNLLTYISATSRRS